MSQMRITIRPLRLSDANDIHELMHMPNVLWGMSLLPSTTVDEWRKIIEGWVHNERMHVFVAEIQGKAVGTISLQVGEGRESHVGEIVMAVHDKHQGQGIGKMLMMTVIDLADNWLNLLRLEADAYSDNERAIHLLGLFDFEIEGRKRLDAFRGGHYIDSYMLARLRSLIGRPGTNPTLSSQTASLQRGYASSAGYSTGLQEEGGSKTTTNDAETITRVPESPQPLGPQE